MTTPFRRAMRFAVRGVFQRGLPGLAFMLASPFVELSPAQIPSVAADQEQSRIARGHSLDASTRRSQDFVPEDSPLCDVAVNLKRTGPAGSVVVELRSSASTLLWQGTIPESDVVDGWNRVSLARPLALAAGERYSVSLHTRGASPTSTNRYFWQGSASASYEKGAKRVDEVSSGSGYALKTYTDRSAAMPSLTFAVDRASYRLGEVVWITGGTLSGDCPERNLEWRMWLNTPDGTRVPMLRLEGLRLEAGRPLDLTGGRAVPLVQLRDSLQAGEWEIGHRIVDADTGSTVALFTTWFTVLAVDGARASPQRAGDQAQLRSAVKDALLFHEIPGRATVAEGPARHR